MNQDSDALSDGVLRSMLSELQKLFFRETDDGIAAFFISLKVNIAEEVTARNIRLDEMAGPLASLRWPQETD